MVALSSSYFVEVVVYDTVVLAASYKYWSRPLDSPGITEV